MKIKIKQILFFIFLALVSGKMIYVVLDRHVFTENFRTYHYDKEKQDYCFLEFQGNRFQDYSSKIFLVLEYTVLKPNHVFLPKAFDEPLTIQDIVWFEPNHLVINLNQNYLNLSSEEEKWVVQTLLLGIYYNFPLIDRVSFLVNNRVIDEINRNYYYRFPLSPSTILESLKISNNSVAMVSKKSDALC